MIKFTHFFVALLVAAGSCSAATLTFGCIPDVSTSCTPNLTTQISAEVTDAGGTSVDFTFRNVGVIPSFISDIYFDTLPGYFSSFSVQTASAGVSFRAPSAGGNLPRGNSLTPTFDEDWQVHNSPGSANGINPGESLVLRAGGQTFDVVLASLQSSALRVGLHIQGIGASSVSDAYLNDAPGAGQAIPEPSTYSMILIGIGLAAASRIRRRIS
jgi:hypothetical protein